MKNFILKTILVCVLAALPFALYLLVFANGKGDPFLLRFNTPQQQSLILGTSRVAQGLLPEVFNQSQADFSRPMYNFSFTVNSSPYGPVYYEAIKNKLKPNAKNGIFVLGVCPNAITRHIKNPADSVEKYREHEAFLNKVSFFNGSFNPDYLFRGYSEQYINLAVNNVRSLMELHPDGWLEINVPMDSTSIKSRTKSKMKKYQKSFFGPYQKSPLRMDYLSKTISLLQQQGRVYLVRMPVGHQMRALEQWFMPDFDQMMEQLSTKHKVNYYNLDKDKIEYLTTDGNHLYKTEGRKVSQLLLKMIEEDLAQNPMK